MNFEPQILDIFACQFCSHAVFTPIGGGGVNVRLSALFLGDLWLVYDKAMETPRPKKDV